MTNKIQYLHDKEKYNLDNLQIAYLFACRKDIELIKPGNVNIKSPHPDTMREDRKQLVGLLTDDPKVVLEEGAQIVSELNKNPVEMLGHVTSSYFSPNLNKSIALAVVRGGRDMIGKKLFVPMEDKTINVTVSNPVFFDQTNERLNA